MNSQTPKAHYQKPWQSHAGQVARLVARGLVVPNPTQAEQFLSHVNYYRFSGYCPAFERPRHVFPAGVTFDDVANAYLFDTTLRDLLTEALEVLEIDVRSWIAHHFGKLHGAFGHTHSTNFHDPRKHPNLLDHFREEADRSRELFVDHFKTKYAEFPDLPVWMLTEVISFGTLTRMYRNMKRSDQQVIATRYGLQATCFETILLHLVYVRNLCAHHSRLWDRVWSIKPNLPHGKMWSAPLLNGNDRLFSTLCLVQHLLRKCSAIGPFATEWKNRLHPLLKSSPNTPQAHRLMGLTAHWDQHPIW
jgi:abortive infection bacteriophage resistance protein